MVHINYEHINRPAPEGTFGGEICMCPDCRSRERNAVLKSEEKKSRKITLTQLNEAFDYLHKLSTQLEEAQDAYQKQEKDYQNLLKRASATVVKQHTLEK